MSETLSKLADDLFDTVKGFISRRLTPIEQRVRALEDRKPENGKDADPLLVQALVRSEVAEAVGRIRQPEDGKSVDPLVIRSMIEAEVAIAVGKTPKPSNGKDFDPDLLTAEVERVVGAIPRPRNGKDADPELIKLAAAALLPGLVEKAEAALSDRMEGRVEQLRRDALDAVSAQVKALPPAAPGKDANAAEIAADVLERVMRQVRVPEDGKSVTMVEVRPIIDTEIERRMALVPAPKNGTSVTVDDVRPLLEGAVSRWELDFERRAADLLQRAVDRMPRPKDGLGFDDLDFEEKDDRTVVFVFRNGEREKRFEYTLPMLIDRGTFKAGETYQRGDAFTYGGSLFIAQRDTLPTEKPEDGSGAFRLAVKRGRDAS